jgi:transcriptional regulator with XRE-family HTH domain
MAPRRKRPDVSDLIRRLDDGKNVALPAPTSAPPKPRFLVEAEARRVAVAVAVAAAPVTEPQVEPEPAPERPSRKPRKPDGPPTEEDLKLGANLARLIKRRGISGRELSRRADLSLDSVRNILTGRSTSPRARTLQALADVLDVPLSALYGGEALPRYVKVQIGRSVTIREMVPSPSATLADGDVAAEWSIPMEAIGSHDPANLCIFTAPPGMLPSDLLPGDRVLADLSHVEPSPPGTYVMSDGSRVYLALVRRVVGKEGKILLAHGGRTELVAEKSVRIIGKVIARWTAV